MLPSDCTVAGNSAGLGGGLLGWAPSMAMIANSVFWGNWDLSGFGEQAQLTTASDSLSYCCVQNWTGLIPPTDPSCRDADLDQDYDVDQADFGMAQRAMRATE